MSINDFVVAKLKPNKKLTSEVIMNEYLNLRSEVNLVVIDGNDMDRIKELYLNHMLSGSAKLSLLLSGSYIDDVDFESFKDELESFMNNLIVNCSDIDNRQRIMFSNIFLKNIKEYLYNFYVDLLNRYLNNSAVNYSEYLFYRMFTFDYKTDEKIIEDIKQIMINNNCVFGNDCKRLLA